MTKAIAEVVRPAALFAALLLTGAALEAQPSIVTSSPSSGSGATQSFTVTWSSSNWGGSGSVQFLANWGVSGSNACYAVYYQSSNLLYLMNDASTQLLGGSAPGTLGATVSNSQCTLNIQNSSASLSGNNLTVTFSIAFNSSFFGTQQLYAYASDASLGSNWQTEGTWTPYSAPYSQPPCTPSYSCTVAPASGTGMSATFAFTSSDLNGAGYIPEEFIYIGPNATSSCILLVYHATSQAYLLNDDNSGWLAVPASGSVSNSQCTINGTSGSDSGNNWTFNVSATFSTAYAGTKPLYFYVDDHSDQLSAFQQVGTWTVPGAASSVSVPVFSPASGIYSAAQTVTLSSATCGATIRYTLDGSTPSQTHGTVYSVPISVASEEIVNAIAYAQGVNSAVSSAIYYFEYPTGGTTGGANAGPPPNTPPADSGNGLDPRRVGVRALGSYWGDAGENLDTDSGNLSFADPLIKPRGRGSWSLPFMLSYNSQMWRHDSGGDWLLGQDVGYGVTGPINLPPRQVYGSNAGCGGVLSSGQG